jgi:hypothetical protein
MWSVGALLLTSLAVPELRAQYANPPDAYSLTELNAMFGVPVTMNIDRDGSKALVDNSYPQQPGAASGGHTRALYDLPAKSSMNWDLQNASVPCGKSTFSGDWGDPFAFSAEIVGDLNKQHATEAGTAVINGISTKLYEADAQGNKASVWVEPKYGLVVKMEMTDKSGKTQTMVEVKQFSVTKPAASVLTLPASCAAAANAPRTPTDAERIAAETGEDASNFASAIMPGGANGACSVSLRVVRAGTMQPVTAGFQVAIDPQVDLDHPAAYSLGTGANGRTNFSGGHLTEMTGQLRNGVLVIDNAPARFDVELSFGKAGFSSSLIYRQCQGPQTVLLFVVKNTDKLSDGGDWLWVKSGKYAK